MNTKSASVPPVLTIENWTVAYGDSLPVLQDINLEVFQGEVLGLIGQSGAGKSTLALSLMDLLPPGARVLSGRLRWRGEELRRGSRAHRGLRGTGIGMIFQGPREALNPVTTVRVQLREALRRHRRMSKAEADSAATELLRYVGFRDPQACIGLHPHELSQGMCQRIGIALALACRPVLLVGDEATSALDVTVQAHVLRLLLRLRRELGLALLLITHDVGVVAECCDRVVVLADSRIVERGRTVEIFSEPDHPQTRRLLEIARA